MAVYGPLDHYDYGEIDGNCSCAICCEWRENLASYLDILKDRSQEDYREDKETMRLRSLYLAAVHRREAYCEMSYHASLLPCGFELMTWVGRQVTTQDNNWWEHKAPQTTIGEWLQWFAQEQSAFAAMIRDIDLKLLV